MASSLFDLTGKGALITGGSRGLGKAMARGFAEAGANVMVTSRHEDELRPAVEDIRRINTISVRAKRVAQCCRSVRLFIFASGAFRTTACRRLPASVETILLPQPVSRYQWRSRRWYWS